MDERGVSGTHSASQKSSKIWCSLVSCTWAASSWSWSHIWGKWKMFIGEYLFAHSIMFSACCLVVLPINFKSDNIYASLPWPSLDDLIFLPNERVTSAQSTACGNAKTAIHLYSHYRCNKCLLYTTFPALKFYFPVRGTGEQILAELCSNTKQQMH